MSGNEQSDLTPVEALEAMRDKNAWRIVCGLAAGVLVLVGLIVMGRLMHDNMFSRISGKVTSIELTNKPANPNDQGDYTVHLVRADGDELVATCAQSLCYKLQPGDTISVDLDVRDNSLADPLTITNRP